MSEKSPLTCVGMALVLFVEQIKARVSPLDLSLHGVNSSDVEVLKNPHTVNE